MHRSIKVACIAGALALALIGLLLVWNARWGKLQKEARVGDYVVRVYRHEESNPILERFGKWLPDRFQHWQYRTISDAPSRLVVKRGWRTVHEQEDYLLMLAPAGIRKGEAGDLTGDGVPDLAVEAYSGGAHCCNTLFIYSGGESFELIAQVEGEHSGVKIEDMDGDGIMELKLVDWTFQYWPGSYVGSPAPRVILRWTGDSFAVAGDLMKQPAPSEAEVAAKLAQIREEARIPDYPVQGPAFAYALDLMYSGHEERGWEFLREFFGERFETRETIKEFRELLNRSPYWEQLKEP